MDLLINQMALSPLGKLLLFYFSTADSFLMIRYDVYSRYAHRSFGMAQWKGLQSKLREMRKNITAVKDQMAPAVTNKPAV